MQVWIFLVVSVAAMTWLLTCLSVLYEKYVDVTRVIDSSPTSQVAHGKPLMPKTPQAKPSLSAVKQINKSVQQYKANVSRSAYSIINYAVTDKIAAEMDSLPKPNSMSIDNEKNPAVLPSADNHETSTIILRTPAVLNNHDPSGMLNLIQNNGSTSKTINVLVSEAHCHAHQPQSSKQQSDNNSAIAVSQHLMTKITSTILIRNAMLVFSHLTNHSTANNYISISNNSPRCIHIL